MSTKRTAKDATGKQIRQNRETIADQIDSLLGKYKNGTGKKKYEKSLKKASKMLSKVLVFPVSKKTNDRKSAAKTTAGGHS